MTTHAPNILTVVRVLLVPVFVYLLFADARLAALVVFWIAGITDLLDGWLARKHDRVTAFGKIADPIADKALTGAAWVGLSLLGVIPWLATVIILLREVGITVWRLRVLSTQVVEAQALGKWKTTLQIVTISVLLLFPFNSEGLIALGQDVLLWASVVLTVVSAVPYLRQAWDRGHE